MKKSKTVKIFKIKNHYLKGLSIIDLIVLLNKNSEKFNKIFSSGKIEKESILIQASNVKLVQSKILQDLSMLFSVNDEEFEKYRSNLDQQEKQMLDAFIMKTVGSNFADLLLKILFN